VSLFPRPGCLPIVQDLPEENGDVGPINGAVVWFIQFDNYYLSKQIHRQLKLNQDMVTG
jgi:hypothetical protein